MGKVRPSYIKNIAREIVEKYGNILTTNFQKNKKIVAELITCDSKKVRNKITGYVTRLVILQRKNEG